MLKTKKETLMNLGLLFGVLIFSYIVLELVLSLGGFAFLKPSPACYGVSDPILHHAHLPNAACDIDAKTKEWPTHFVSINEFGMRGESFPLEKPDDEFRILMLGDSFTAGMAVDLENTFSKRLETTLNENHDQKYRVMNAGVGSYAAAIHYLYVKNKALQFDPDLVILNMDMSDVHDDQVYTKAGVFEDGDLIAIPPEEGGRKLYGSIILWLKRHSYSFVYFLPKLEKLVYGAPTDETELYTEGDILHDRWAITRNIDSSIVYDEEWETSFDYFRNIKSYLDDNDIPFILTAYPYGHQISGTQWSRGRTADLFEPGVVYSSQPFEILEDFSEEEGITFFNLHPDFLENKNTTLYYDIDPHFNEAGHRVMADAIYSHLIEEDIL